MFPAALTMLAGTAVPGGRTNLVSPADTLRRDAAPEYNFSEIALAVSSY